MSSTVDPCTYNNSTTYIITPNHHDDGPAYWNTPGDLARLDLMVWSPPCRSRGLICGLLLTYLVLTYLAVIERNLIATTTTAPNFPNPPNGYSLRDRRPADPAIPNTGMYPVSPSCRCTATRRGRELADLPI
ncbi:uncharacterized protein GGS22DRAFT_169176 [Annulohypoxylon maeteangense]|uniref:uncharacterized protein n=1 Tax=Annulohypoxylon maeteangense TaxID=1927788 RepID=UPI002008B76F|nr:uncharacterized protein GGS22DRAFT_169176 [Annulohypoxylon maeteangense]KAI0882967.1 hypothetical protein GGS22DRAFT_169176 [Annulohypoxylon maeteangense]